MGSEPLEEIEVEGRRLAWHTIGQGRPLLLINGYAATGWDWDPGFLAALADSFEVICPDNRGFRGSELGDGELTVDDMAADLEALLDARGLDRAVLVGWSMGGFVAQRLAARSPARAAALALLATDRGGPDSVTVTAANWARLVDRSGTPRDQASRLVSLLFPPSLAEQMDHQFGDVVATAQAKLALPALQAQEAAMDAWHRDESPGRDGGDALPTLIVHGDLDVVIPIANVDPLASRWPGSRVEILAGCAHAVMAQEPQRVADLISALADD